MSDQGERYCFCAPVAPGAFPIPDNQGQLELCVRFALAKAIIDGFMRKKFVPGVEIDLHQVAVRCALNNEHKDTLGKWPDEFDQKEYQFQSQSADARFWKTTLHIQSVGTFEFEKDQRSTSQYSYVLVYPPDPSKPDVLHCVYIDNFDGRYLNCINSHPMYPLLNIPIRKRGNILYRVDCSATEMISSPAPALIVQPPTSNVKYRQKPPKLPNGQIATNYRRSRNSSSCERFVQESVSTGFQQPGEGLHNVRAKREMSSNTSLNSPSFSATFYESNTSLSSFGGQSNRSSALFPKSRTTSESSDYQQLSHLLPGHQGPIPRARSVSSFWTQRLCAQTAPLDAQKSKGMKLTKYASEANLQPGINNDESSHLDTKSKKKRKKSLFGSVRNFFRPKI